MAGPADTLSDEIWKPAPGWEDGYEVSNLGRVRSIERDVEFAGRWGPSTRHLPARLLSLNVSNHYLGLTVRRVGEKAYRHVHRLVCEAFHGAPPTPSHQASHVDGNRLNNAATNLRWATPVENNADKKRHGTYTKGDRHNRTKLPDAEVARLRASRDTNMADEMAEKYRMSKWHLRSIMNGKVR